MQKYKRTFLLSLYIIGFITILPACSKDWNCGSQEGFRCKSISEIDSEFYKTNNRTNNRANNKTPDQAISQKIPPKDTKKKRINTNIYQEIYNKQETSQRTDSDTEKNSRNPIRTKEKLGRILILPYIDKNGYFHSSKYIYTVDEKPRWK